LSQVNILLSRSLITFKEAKVYHRGSIVYVTPPSLICFDENNAKQKLFSCLSSEPKLMLQKWTK